jgi:hypothetical protein
MSSMTTVRAFLTLLAIGLLIARFVRKRRAEQRFATARRLRAREEPPTDREDP